MISFIFVVHNFYFQLLLKLVLKLFFLFARMYRAHSKDINRNKSFHTLTFRNLRKVEILRDKEDKNKTAREDRQKELRKDQDEQRYEELIGGEGSFKGTRHIKNIFAAEYEADSAQTLKANRISGDAVQRSSLGDYSLAKKFVKDEESKIDLKENSELEKKRGVKTLRECCSGGEEIPPQQQFKYEENSSPNTVETFYSGFISSSESVLRRKEAEKMKKEKVDPLQKLKSYQNKTVAAASRRNHREQEEKSLSLASKQSDATKDAIRARMKELLGGKFQ